MTPALGVQNKILLCLFFPYSSFNSMKNSQGTKQFCLDLTFPVWLQTAGGEGERGLWVDTLPATSLLLCHHHTRTCHRDRVAQAGAQ